MLRHSCMQILPQRFLLNTTCPISSVPLKEKLMKNLKAIRGCNNAHKLCGELIYAKNIFENPGTVPSSFYFNYKRDAKSSIQCMQHILYNEQPEFILVDIIWMVLHKSRMTVKVTTDDTGKNELMSLVMNILKFSVPFFTKEMKSEEFLRQVLKDMECIINSNDENSLYYRFCKENSPGGLCLLQFVLLKLTLDKADELLDTVLQVGRANLHFSEEEKKKCGTLMVETIEPIFKSVLRMQIEEFDISWLQTRSALQFYKDVFAKFPTEDGALVENFFMNKVNRSIDRVDGLITSWCDYVTDVIDDGELGYLYCFSIENTIADLEKARASEMPKYHTWWTECSTLLKKVKSVQMSKF